MIICPIAMAVHCTGCPLVKFCPAKTILGDFGKVPDAGVKPADVPRVIRTCGKTKLSSASRSFCSLFSFCHTCAITFDQLFDARPSCEVIHCVIYRRG